MKIKGWKLKDESVRVEFEKRYEKRMESLMQSNKTDWEKIYVETGKEICGETTGILEQKEKLGGGMRRSNKRLEKRKKRTRNDKKNA